MVPKNFKTNININPGKIGPARRKEILDNIADKGTFLPKGISHRDMDDAFDEFLNNELSITIDGVKVPVFFLTLQRWSEFSKTWKFTNEDKEVKMPFITIVRRPDVQVGTNQAGLWNIPGGQTYTYMKVPTWDGTRQGTDVYKIPQPTSVDITYEVRLFALRLRNLNVLNELVQRTFQSRQAYINVKGHPMPVVLETISDESNIENFEERRFYVQQFEMRLMGYLLNEDDFEIVPTINRLYTFLEVGAPRSFRNVIFDPQIKNNSLVYTAVFKPKANQFVFTAKYNLVFTNIINIDRITNILITLNNMTIVNGLRLNVPVTVNAGDTIYINVTKSVIETGSFQLIGNSL